MSSRAHTYPIDLTLPQMEALLDQLDTIPSAAIDAFYPCATGRACYHRGVDAIRTAYKAAARASGPRTPLRDLTPNASPVSQDRKLANYVQMQTRDE